MYLLWIVWAFAFFSVSPYLLVRACTSSFVTLLICTKVIINVEWQDMVMLVTSNNNSSQMVCASANTHCVCCLFMSFTCHVSWCWMRSMSLFPSIQFRESFFVSATQTTDNSSFLSSQMWQWLSQSPMFFLQPTWYTSGWIVHTLLRALPVCLSWITQDLLLCTASSPWCVVDWCCLWCWSAVFF